MPITDRDPIFVVGVGRSGTSLLQSMLAAHSELAVPPETGFVRRYLATGRITKIAARKGSQGVEELLRSDRRLQRTGLSAAQIVSAINGREHLTDIAVYRSLLQSYAHVQGKSISGDKDPRLVEFLLVLHQHFPNAHVVHLIRDPRDVLASKKKAKWSSGRYWLSHVFANRVQIEMGRTDGLRFFGSHYHELTYESLITDPKSVLRKLCAGLGIDFEVDMLRFSAAAEQLVSDEERDWKGETLGPLLTDNAGKWRSDLSEWEVAITERVCWRAMQLGGYHPSHATTKLGFLTHVAMDVCVASIGTASFLYMVWRRFYTRIAGMKQ